MKRIALLALTALVTGCMATTSPVETANYLHHRFYDRPVNEFFYAYGKPAGQSALGNGDIAYRWVSIEPGSEPAGTEYHSYPSPGGNYAVPTGSAERPVEASFCEIKIITDPKGIIKTFVPVADTMGKWGGSLCSEVFSTPTIP